MPNCKCCYKLPLPALDGSRGTTSFALSGAPAECETRSDEGKYSTPRRAIVNIFREYCSNSTIHGMNYLGEERRHCLERIFWIFIFILSIYSCSQLIHSTWRKWDETPVIVSFSEKSTPVWEIPFPAITICPETKTQQKLFNFTKFYGMMLASLDDNDTSTVPKQLEKEEFKHLRALLQVCESYLLDDINFEPFTAVDIISLLEEVAPSFNLTYPFCKWKNVLSDCVGLFNKVITEEGVCYTFNGFNSLELYREGTVNYNLIWEQQQRGKKQWSLQNGYDSDAGTDAYPERVLGAGAKPGLFLVLQGFEYNMDYICRGPIQGFKVLLHSPDDVPQVSKHYVRVPFGKEVLISVHPNMITTSDNLKGYSPKRRQCYFSEERYLKYFQTYSQSKCELECLANYTLQKCNCVEFSMPRTPGTPICDISSIKCYQKAEDSLLRREFTEGLNGSTENVRGETTCNCLPACTSLSYNAEISQADFEFARLLNAFNDTYLIDHPSVKISRLSLFFKENQFITSKRSELYGVTDFLANCGGLFGLFMGVSALSLVEIFYSYTIRLFFNVRTERRS